MRPVEEADLPVVLELGEELREQLLSPEAPVRGRTATAGRAVLEQRYHDAIADPQRHLVLAVSGPVEAEQVLGMAMLTVASTNALLDVPAVHVSHVVVAGRQRKRGAGRALVAAAAAFADDRGIDQLVVSVNPGSREAARFFARLGFAPLAVRRTAPVAVVKRRLVLGERCAEPVPRRRVTRPAAVAARARQS
ncbi:MAG TPA: GNAT family N-acetyltransferase [Mycobacteriales bacterium]|nr:GNAT family N-acetyltransferase [Mycobacteriales bacterium]